MAASAPASAPAESAPAPALKSAAAEQPKVTAPSAEKASSGAEAIMAELSPSLRRMIADQNLMSVKLKALEKVVVLLKKMLKNSYKHQHLLLNLSLQVIEQKNVFRCHVCVQKLQND